MGTISYAQVPPTSATIALNAYIYGFGGHSLVTPHAALKQLWWTEDRIDGKVTRKFVVSQIKGEERDFLDRPLAFGEGLTDDTYMEWILGRARRLFLILAEIGKPEQIFGLIDDSLDDDDLPFSFESIVDMDLCVEPDERLNRKFHATQYLYLLRELDQGGHIDYGPQEHIPMEHVHKVPPAVPLQSWDRIHFPKDHEHVFVRRKFTFGTGNDKDDLRQTYMQDLAEAKRLAHPHIARVWASYTAGDAGFVLSDFVPEHTLASFIAHRTPYQFMRVPQAERPVILLEWMHCLIDALAMLHHRGISHGAIRPSNIVIDHDNCIAFSDVGVLRTFQRGKKFVKNEASGYSAPETHLEEKVRGVHFADSLSSTIQIKRSSDGSTLSGASWSSSSPPKLSDAILIQNSSSMVDSPMNSFGQSSISSPIPLFRNFSRHLPPPPTFASANIWSPSTGKSRRLLRKTKRPPASSDSSPSDGSPKLSGFDVVESSHPIPISPDRRPSWASWGTTPCPTSSTASDPSSLLSELLNEPLSVPKPLVIRKTTSRSSLSKDNNNLGATSTHQDTGFESDVFSLGCVYLDLVTYIVKGKLSDLQKFRAQTKAPLPTDTATLHTWLAHLASDAIRLSPTVHVLSALVPILGVVRDMLLPDPSHRPTALTIRDRIAAALEQANLHSLCCKDRTWDPELAAQQRPRLSTRRPFKPAEKESTDTSLETESSADGGSDSAAEGPDAILRRSLSVGSGVLEKNGGSKMKRLKLGWMKKPHAKGF
ncbi:hypothetical protein QM012_003540 [Aureobasidium pullulans]|uniref:Protein kinase domain-containing protein n=1 Tax=Aureobasidium pullulans TaxID=5580 RepID=A0ABR0TA07_AURPU